MGRLELVVRLNVTGLLVYVCLHGLIDFFNDWLCSASITVGI